uniref:Myb-like domain-containing protein n=1 Tax=Leersia perrieri TaxID=77586 RepID=A0A0D9WNY2_9ORYZ
MEVDDDVEEDDMDFNPLLREGSPSETSSSLTSEAECEEASFNDQRSSEVPHDNFVDEHTGDCAHPQSGLPSEGTCNENNNPESTSSQVPFETGDGCLNGLEEEALPSEAARSPSLKDSHNLLVEGSEEDAICRRTRAKYSLENHSLEELETFLQESDDDGDLQNVDEQEEYRKFLAAVLSGVDDGTQACQGDENQDEDENDADFELEIEEALESDGDENVENYEDTNIMKDKDGRRRQTRKNRPSTELSGPIHEHYGSTKSSLRPILPYISPELLASGQPYGWQYPPQSAFIPAFVNGFTDQQLGRLHMLIYEHVQLLIQTFSLCVLDPSKQQQATDVKKMIVELVGCRDQALASRSTIHRQFCFEPQHLCSSFSFASSETLQYQWMPLIKSPVMSILDVSPLHLAPGYLNDVADAVVKYRRSHVDGTADKNRLKKEPLFPTTVFNTCKDANKVSQGRSNNVSVASPDSSGKSQQKKSLAATLFENTKKESVALVPFDIARLAQRFKPLFNFSLFPHKPPPTAMANRVLFTDAEDGLLALGLLEYNNDWGAIQKRFLPCKSKHQIFVRQKNRSSSKAPDNPIKDVRRMKTSPLTNEEQQRIQEGLNAFKNDWASVWRFVVPHRDPLLLPRQWRSATGVQKSYNKSEAEKEKRRSYEAKRRKLKASMPNSQVVHGQEADNNGSEGAENDDDDGDDSYVNEAFLADTENRTINLMPYQLSLPRNAGNGTTMQSGSSLYEESGVAGDSAEQQKGNSTNFDVTASYLPFRSCTSDVLSSKRKVQGGSKDQQQASQFAQEKGSCVVKLAPDLPPVNLPPSVRVISQVAFHQNATQLNGTSDNVAKDLFPVPPPNFTESIYRQLNLFPDHSSSDRLCQNGISNENTTEDGAEQDFQMHPLLFQYPREALSSYNHPVQNLINHSRNLFPFEKVQTEKINNQTTDCIETRTPVNDNTIDFHPLLQRTEVDMHGEVQDDCSRPYNQSECNMTEAPTDDQSTARQKSSSPCEKENNIDLDIHLCSSRDFMNGNDTTGASSKFNDRAEVTRKDKASISELEDGNARSHHVIEEPNEESMQGIVMEQEELSDSEEDSQHVEFECEEMDDSDEDQVQGVDSLLAQNKEVSTSVGCGEYQGSNIHSQNQQTVQAGKQGAATQKLQKLSNTRPAREKLKGDSAKRTGYRASQRSSTAPTSEPSQTKTKRPKTQQVQIGAERKSNDSRRSRKKSAPS